MGGGIEAGKAFVKFLLDDKELKKGLQSAGTSLRKWGSIGMAATAPVVAGLTACVTAAVNVGSRFADLASKTGIGVEALSEIAFAAQRSGVELGSVERAARKMTLNIASAATGSKAFVAALGQLGISLAELRAMNPTDQFIALSRAIADVPDHTLRAALAAKIFGKAGAELLPLLAAGSQGFDEARQQAHLFGVTLTAEEVAALDRLGDALGDAKEQLVHLTVAIGGALAGPLADFFEGSRKIVGTTIRWIKANPDLVRGIALVTTAIFGVSAAAYAFGTVLGVLTAHPIVAALTVIGLLLVGIAKYFGWASAGAEDFTKQLEKIKVPGLRSGAEPDLQKQAADFQARLNTTMGPGPVMAPAGQVAASAARVAADGMTESIRWLKDIAVSNRRIVQLMRSDQGLLVWGSG